MKQSVTGLLSGVTGVELGVLGAWTASPPNMEEVLLGSNVNYCPVTKTAVDFSMLVRKVTPRS